MTVACLLVALVLFLALLPFAGCEYQATEAKVYLMLNYDPGLVVANKPVSIKRVDFVVKPGDRDDTNTESLIDGEGAIRDVSGWTWSSGDTIPTFPVADVTVIDPANGDFVFIMTIIALYLLPAGFSHWTVTCNAYRDPNGPIDYAASGPIELDLPENGVAAFGFKLGPDGNIVVDMSTTGTRTVPQ